MKKTGILKIKIKIEKSNKLHVQKFLPYVL